MNDKLCLNRHRQTNLIHFIQQKLIDGSLVINTHCYNLTTHILGGFAPALQSQHSCHAIDQLFFLSIVMHTTTTISLITKTRKASIGLDQKLGGDIPMDAQQPTTDGAVPMDAQ